MVSFDFTKTPITQVADYIIIAASKHNASDIHFDPREDGMMVRFRIDGDCQDYTFVPKAYERNLTTRLKLLANMNITESRLPQDGAIKGDYGGTYLDMRVSVLPVNEGEKVVIRILDYTRSLSGIDTLGFHPANLAKIKRMMGIPNGIILTTGATGSGKSTTNYSILQGLNKPETNIITVEDPIEMNIEGINQVQVNAEIGMTFAAALRSILRQDPNIILIGEIRDSETAQIAVRASITGHLVLSTIHTNNSLATIERLLDMDVERYLLSTALTGIISQRLAKMLCPDCRIQRETTKYEKKVFKKYLHQDVPLIWDANPKGCEHCRNGYHGRIAIHEVLELDDDIRSALNNDKLEKKELAKMVYTSKTITMLQDALIKALEGKTTFEEVYRVIEIENEDDENYEQELSIIMPKVEKKEENTYEEQPDSLLDFHEAKPKAVSDEAIKKEEVPVAKANNTIVNEASKNKEVSQVQNKNVSPTQVAIPKGSVSSQPIPASQQQNVSIPSPGAVKPVAGQTPQKVVTIPSGNNQAVNSTVTIPQGNKQVKAPEVKVASSVNNNVNTTQQSNPSPIPKIVIPPQTMAQVSANKQVVPQQVNGALKQQQPVQQVQKQVVANSNTQFVNSPKQVVVANNSAQQLQQIMQRPPLQVKK